MKRFINFTKMIKIGKQLEKMKGNILFWGLLIFLVACSSSNITPNSESVAGTQVSGEDVPSDTVGTTKEFNLIAKKWEFIPSTIEVNGGDKVILNINSVDVDHGFSISAFNVNENLKAGKTTRIEFIADKKGSYTFFCSVFCGSGHPLMKGELIVN